jgi:hypothetical protein
MTQQVINVGSVADDGTGDDLRSAFVKTNANFTELYAGSTLVKLQRYVTTTPIVVAATDQIIACWILTPAACALPVASTRTTPITFKDLGQAAANNITLTPAVGDTIDGLATFVLRNNYAWVTLVPITVGPTAGWMLL